LTPLGFASLRASLAASEVEKGRAGAARDAAGYPVRVTLYV
jgi:hypothetical protein